MPSNRYLCSFSTIDTAGPVRSPLDEMSLRAYLSRALSIPPSISAHVNIQQFGHGQSNPTFLLTVPTGPSGTEPRMVMRKKPAGKILSSAHAVEREYTIISALHRVGLKSPSNAVPVPRPLAMCEDILVLGTPFYLMEFSEGTIYLVRAST